MTDDTKRQLLNAKLNLLENSIYDAKLDVKVAEVLEDADMAAKATARIKKLLAATEMLTREVEALEHAV